MAAGDSRPLPRRLTQLGPPSLHAQLVQAAVGGALADARAVLAEAEAEAAAGLAASGAAGGAASGAAGDFLRSGVELRLRCALPAVSDSLAAIVR